MAQLRYRGAPVTASTDLAHRPYPATLKSGDLSAGAVDALVADLLDPYVTADYAQDQDALLATPTFVDTEDAKRVPLTLRGAPNGVAPLDNSGKIPPSFFPVPSTQKWNAGPWTPASYMAGSATITSSETTLYTCPVANPGWPYKLLVFGHLDGTVFGDDIYPLINVRVGSGSGTIIARGRGAADGVPTYTRGDNFQRPDANNLGEGWNVTYTGDGNSAMVISNGEAVLTQAVTPNNYWRQAVCQRVDPASRYTGTNYQMIACSVGGNAGSPFDSGPDNGGRPNFRLYLRANDAMTQYVAWEIVNNEAKLIYNTGTGEKQLGTAAATDWSANTTWYGYAGGDFTGTNERKFSLYKGTTLVNSVTDSAMLTALGTGNRGWGFGLKNTLFVLGQAVSPSIEQIYVLDIIPAYEPTPIVPYNLHSSSSLTGSTTLYVTGQRSTSSAQPFVTSDYRPHLHVMAIPA